MSRRLLLSGRKTETSNCFAVFLGSFTFLLQYCTCQKASFCSRFDDAERTCPHASIQEPNFDSSFSYHCCNDCTCSQQSRRDGVKNLQNRHSLWMRLQVQTRACQSAFDAGKMRALRSLFARALHYLCSMTFPCCTCCPVQIPLAPLSTIFGKDLQLRVIQR